MASCWLSSACKMSFCTRKSAVSTLCLALYADWVGAWRLLLSRYFWSCATTARSITLQMKLMFDIGRKLLSSFVQSPGFLSLGVIIARLRDAGTEPVCRLRFVNVVIAGTRMDAHFLRSPVGIGCRLHVDEFDILMIFMISSWETGRNSEKVSRQV